jgi:hypothetical protein
VTRALLAVVLATAVVHAQPEPEPEPAAPAEPLQEPAQPGGPTEEPPPPPPPPTVASPVLVVPKRRTPFDRGRFGLTAGAGSTSAFGVRYFAIGAGASYFVLDGVAVGLGTQVQWGDGPTIFRTTPELRYVAQPLIEYSPVIPYVGVFYTHWFIGNRVNDVDAVGTRGGLLYVSGSIVLGLGVAYEHLVSRCAMDCWSVYPDITISVAL